MESTMLRYKYKGENTNEKISYTNCNIIYYNNCGIMFIV